MNKSYGITIRPKCGVNDEFIQKICKSLESYSYYYVIVEKEGVEAHIHAQIWSNHDLRKGDVKKKITRICEKYDWWDIHHKRYCICIKICYNDWLSDYCVENEGKWIGAAGNGGATMHMEEIIREDPVNSEKFYPSKEEQELVQAKYRSKNQRYFDLKVKLKTSDDYDEHHWGIEHTAQWVLNGMYVRDDIMIIECHKRRKEFIKSFHWFVVAKINAMNGLAGDDLIKYIYDYGQG